jgi:hypothetical protein
VRGEASADAVCEGALVFHLRSSGHDVAPQDVLADAVLQRIDDVRCHTLARRALLVTTHYPLVAGTGGSLNPFEGHIKNVRRLSVQGRPVKGLPPQQRTVRTLL